MGRLDTSGIYIIVSHESRKVYVGSTTQGFGVRWSSHRSCLRRGIHHNPHLQAAWNKYGVGDFECIVCEYVDDPDKIIEREQYWLDWHRMQAEVYNVGAIAAAPMLGRPRSEETRRKISRAKKGRVVISGEQRQRSSEVHRGKTLSKAHRRVISSTFAKPFPAFIHCETGEVIPAGTNLLALCRERGLVDSCMHRVMNGERGSHKGWVVY